MLFDSFPLDTQVCKFQVSLNMRLSKKTSGNKNNVVKKISSEIPQTVLNYYIDVIK